MFAFVYFFKYERTRDIVCSDLGQGTMDCSVESCFGVMYGEWYGVCDLLLLLFAFQSMFISIWVSRLEIAEFPDSVRRSAP